MYMHSMCVSISIWELPEPPPYKARHNSIDSKHRDLDLPKIHW